MLCPHVPLGRRTLSSLRATCACRGREPSLSPPPPPPATTSRDRLGLRHRGLAGGEEARLVPASPCPLLEEEPWMISRLCGLTRLRARDEDQREEDEEDEEVDDRVEGESFCDGARRKVSEPRLQQKRFHFNSMYVPNLH